MIGYGTVNVKCHEEEVLEIRDKLKSMGHSWTLLHPVKTGGVYTFEIPVRVNLAVGTARAA